MATIGTAFKKVYGEALAPYGFRKIKGKQPYLARMIGDEIVQVITFRNETSLRGGYKAFDILCGVATVYRGEITLDCSPKDNLDWLDNNRYLYGKRHCYDYDSEYAKNLYPFYYMPSDEESIYEALNQSLEKTKQVMLPELEKVMDLTSCLEYFRFFRPDLLHIYSDENFGRRWGGWRISEGLLSLKICTVEEYKKHKALSLERSVKEDLYLIQKGRSGYTKEDVENKKREQEQIMLERIVIFERMKEDSEQYDRVLKELESRKVRNFEVLKLFGIE